MTRPLILLVDDARDMGLIVGRLGSRCGHDVEHKPDAGSAMEFLRLRRPSLMLLDVNLIGTSGPELCRQIRRDPPRADLPIALFTREDLAEDIAAGLEAGADFFVSKDLVVQPEAWSMRLAEILAALHSHGRRLSVRSVVDETGSPETSDWIAVVNGALRPAILRRLAPAVVRALLRRAVSRALHKSEPDSCLTPDGCALDASKLSSVGNQAAVALAAALAEEVWCMIGTAASAPFRAMLATAFPRIAELLTIR